jgi:hypothetical protein
MGEANKRTLELVRNWCAHLAIDKQGGGGLVEQFTSLPIGPRSLSCPHAAAPGFTGSDLKFLAVDFYDRNCIGCAHRKPVGFANLSSFIRERDTARAATAAEATRRDVAAAAALQERDAKRQAIRSDLTPPGINVIDQIEDLDHDRDGADANRLVETAKLAPEVFTPPVLEYAFELVEAGECWFDSTGLRLLRELNADRGRLTRCALLCLPRLFAAEIAAEILLENVALADETMVGAAVPALISMAKPRRLPLASQDRRPDPAPLIRSHAAFPKAVETAIAALLDGADPYDASRAARGITALAAHNRTLPGRFVRAMVGKFIRDRRLLQAVEHSDGDGETLSELREAIALAFEAEPAETDELLKAFLVGASEIGEARIFSIYREVLRQPQFNDGAEVTQASRLALKRVVWHATETNSQTTLREISNLLSDRPWGLTPLAAAEVRNLLGAAIVIDGKLQSLSAAPPLDDPSSLTAMERASRRDVVHDLRRSLIRWAATGAGQAPDGAKVYLEVLAGLPSEGNDAIKREMVRYLDQLMLRAEGLTATLPHLYSAMVGASVPLRASAVYAVGELHGWQQDNLPSLVFEAFVALLLDPYRIVHQYAARTLRRINLPEEYWPSAKAGLLALIVTYARDRYDDHFLVDCLDFYIDHYADPGQFSGRLGSWLISILEKVEPYVVANEIITFGRAFREHDGYVRLLIRLLGDANAWHIHHDSLTLALTDLPSDVVHRHLQEFENLASAARAQDRRMDGLFIEMLTRAGAWKAAARLARAGVAALPDDAWNRPRKLTADQIRVAAEFEATLAAGLMERVSPLAAEWKAIDEAIEKDWTENAERRDPLRSLRGQN